MGRTLLKGATHTTLSAMEDIVKSPYEGQTTAEVGEFLFQYMQSVINSTRTASGNGQQQPREGPVDEALEVFGGKYTKIIRETSRRIASSGLLYTSEWTDGIIEDSNCGRLPKELLLLCLCDHRIARGDSGYTKRIVKDLQAWGIVSNALRLWKLKKKYPGLARCDNIHWFKKRPNNCFKCILFLARAVTCMKYLEWKFLEIADNTSLKAKIYACLDILESCVVVAEKKTSRKRPMPTAMPVVEAGDLDCERSQESLQHNTSTSSGGDEIQTKGAGENSSKNEVIDLSRRLRCKDSKIIEIVFHPPAPKKAPTLDHSIVKKNRSDLSSRLRDKNCKIVEITFHPEPKEQDVKSPVQHGATSGAKSIPPKEKQQPFSHALFATTKSHDNKITNQTKVVDVPKSFALATKSHLPPYVSDSSSMHSGSNNSNFWYPVEKDEVILSPVQIEMAWLVEESMYCRRSTKVDWVFMMKYASPALQIELRRISDVIACNDEQVFARLLHNGIEAKRFMILRREIKRKLLQKVVRTRMQGILPRLRMANHPLRLKKQQLKLNADNDATAGAARVL